MCSVTIWWRLVCVASPLYICDMVGVVYYCDMDELIKAMNAGVLGRGLELVAMDLEANDYLLTILHWFQIQRKSCAGWLIS